MLSVGEACEYLAERGVQVSRQGVHGLIARNRDLCQRIGGSRKKAGLWLIPLSLLSEYTPAEQQQAAGLVPRTILPTETA